MQHYFIKRLQSVKGVVCMAPTRGTIGSQLHAGGIAPYEKDMPRNDTAYERPLP